MAKDISEIFSQTINKHRGAREKTQADLDRNEQRLLTKLERDFELVKDQVRKLKSQIESHPKVNYCWLFKDKIVIDFRTAPNCPTVQVILRVFHPGNDPYKKGIFGYLPDGYEMAMATVDEAVEFLAVQCGNRLA